MINSLILNTLTPLGVPVAFERYLGNAATYITFFIFNEQGDIHADDVEEITGYSVQVDVWSKGDCVDLAEQVRTAMESAGFSRTSGADLYESETEMYHKAQRFYYFE